MIQLFFNYSTKGQTNGQSGQLGENQVHKRIPRYVINRRAQGTTNNAINSLVNGTTVQQTTVDTFNQMSRLYANLCGKPWKKQLTFSYKHGNYLYNPVDKYGCITKYQNYANCNPTALTTISNTCINTTVDDYNCLDCCLKTSIANNLVYQQTWYAAQTNCIKRFLPARDVNCVANKVTRLLNTVLYAGYNGK